MHVDLSNRQICTEQRESERRSSIAVSSAFIKTLFFLRHPPTPTQERRFFVRLDVCQGNPLHRVNLAGSFGSLALCWANRSQKHQGPSERVSEDGERAKGEGEQPRPVRYLQSQRHFVFLWKQRLCGKLRKNNSLGGRLDELLNI